MEWGRLVEAKLKTVRYILKILCKILKNLKTLFEPHYARKKSIFAYSFNKIICM